MKRSRTLQLILSAPCLGLAVLALGVWLAAPSHRINEESFDLIHEGMTRAEVAAVLGGPSGDYATTQEAREVRDRVLLVLSENDDFCFEGWLSDEAFVWVEFRPDGTTTGTRGYSRVVENDRGSLLELISRWLGW